MNRWKSSRVTGASSRMHVTRMMNVKDIMGGHWCRANWGHLAHSLTYTAIAVLKLLLVEGLPLLLLLLLLPVKFYSTFNLKVNSLLLWFHLWGRISDFSPYYFGDQNVNLYSPFLSALQRNSAIPILPMRKQTDHTQDSLTPKSWSPNSNLVLLS